MHKMKAVSEEYIWCTNKAQKARKVLVEDVPVLMSWWQVVRVQASPWYTQFAGLKATYEALKIWKSTESWSNKDNIEKKGNEKH